MGRGQLLPIKVKESVIGKGKDKQMCFRKKISRRQVMQSQYTALKASKSTHVWEPANDPLGVLGQGKELPSSKS